MGIDALNDQRMAQALSLQAMDVIYPNHHSQCAWGAAVGFLDEAQSKLYKNRYCKAEDKVCAASASDVYRRAYALQAKEWRTMFSDLNAISSEVEAMNDIAQDKFGLLRSLTKGSGLMTSQEAQNPETNFYKKPDLPEYLALWEQRLNSCTDQTYPAWAQDMMRPMHAQQLNGLALRWFDDE